MGYKLTPAPPQPTKTYTVAVDPAMEGVGFLLTGSSGSFELFMIRDPNSNAIACDATGTLYLNLGLVQHCRSTSTTSAEPLVMSGSIYRGSTTNGRIPRFYRIPAAFIAPAHERREKAAKCPSMSIGKAQKAHFGLHNALPLQSHVLHSIPIGVHCS
jgi:hypothetical protein